MAADSASPRIREAYLQASDNMDLAPGSCHLVQTHEADDDCTTFVALLVVQKYSQRSRSSSLKLALVEEALASLAPKANALDASVHLPRIGAGTPSFNWYATERIIRKSLCHHGLSATVYYYSRGTTQHKRRPQPPSKATARLSSQLPRAEAATRHQGDDQHHFPHPGLLQASGATCPLPAPPVASHDAEILSDSDSDTEEIQDLQAALARGGLSSTRSISSPASYPAASRPDDLARLCSEPLPKHLQGRSCAILGLGAELAQAVFRLTIAHGGTATADVGPHTTDIIVPPGSDKSRVASNVRGVRDVRVFFPTEWLRLAHR